jgi:hypothetical protein
MQTYMNLSGFPAAGIAGVIYYAVDTDTQYRWDGSTYITQYTAPPTPANPYVFQGKKPPPPP